MSKPLSVNKNLRLDSGVMPTSQKMDLMTADMSGKLLLPQRTPFPRTHSGLQIWPAWTTLPNNGLITNHPHPRSITPQSI